MIVRNMAFIPKFLWISFLMLLTILLVQDHTYAQKIDPKILKSLRYRHIGPVGNRVTSVVGIPGDPHVYFAGAASGGIWKTEDGGIRWRPGQRPRLFNWLRAVERSQDTGVFFAAGEKGLVLRSEDRGASWQQLLGGAPAPVSGVSVLEAGRAAEAGAVGHQPVRPDGVPER